jgi:hypothetical protein
MAYPETPWYMSLTGRCSLISTAVYGPLNRFKRHFLSRIVEVVSVSVNVVEVLVVVSVVSVAVVVVAVAVVVEVAVLVRVVLLSVLVVAVIAVTEAVVAVCVVVKVSVVVVVESVVVVTTHMLHVAGQTDRPISPTPHLNLSRIAHGIGSSLRQGGIIVVVVVCVLVVVRQASQLPGQIAPTPFIAQSSSRFTGVNTSHTLASKTPLQNNEHCFTSIATKRVWPRMHRAWHSDGNRSMLESYFRSFDWQKSTPDAVHFSMQSVVVVKVCVADVPVTVEVVSVVVVCDIEVSVTVKVLVVVVDVIVTVVIVVSDFVVIVLVVDVVVVTDGVVVVTMVLVTVVTVVDCDVAVIEVLVEDG